MAVLVVVVAGFLTIVGFQLGPAERPYERSLDASFAASVGPIAEETNYTGRELASILHGSGPHLDRATILATIESMAGDAASVVDQFENLTPPRNLFGAASSCLESLRQRSAALASLQHSVSVLLSASVDGDPSPGAETSIEGLEGVLSGSDEDWSRCRHDMMESPGRLENALPESRWVGSKTMLTQASVVQFVSTVLTAATSRLAEPLAIVTVSSDPLAVRTPSGSQVLPATRTLSVRVVVADTGTLAEHGVVVNVAVEPIGASGSPASARSSGDIAAGESCSFHVPALAVSPGATYELTVTVAGPRQTSPVRASYRIAVASENGSPA